MAGPDTGPAVGPAVHPAINPGIGPAADDRSGLATDPPAAVGWIRPVWDAPAGVTAGMSTRQGGASTGAWASLNISGSVGDEPGAVAENRRRVARALGAPLVWLHLVHGADVVRVGHASLGQARPVADAAWTDEAGVACCVTAADCLPVLLCTADGRAVAAAHAGWRGLAAGVLERTVAAMTAGVGCAPGDVQAWLGPCIGPTAFEVGAEVLQAFGGRLHSPHLPQRFVPSAARDGSPRWRADLAALACDRLAAAGVHQVSADGRCTVADRSQFFSYRRDRITGRMVAAIWRR